MSQIDIFGQSKRPGRVAPRQETVLQLLAEHPEDGCSLDEIGAAIHAARGKHTVDEVCKWCGPDGRDIMRALERKGTVEKSSVVGKYVLKVDRAAGGAAFGEFPEGY